MKNKKKLFLVKQAAKLALPAGVGGLGGAALGGLIGAFTDQGALRGAGIGGLTGLGLGAGATAGGYGGMMAGSKLSSPDNVENLLKEHPDASGPALGVASNTDNVELIAAILGGGVTGVGLGAGGGSLAGYLAGNKLFGKKKKKEKK